MLGSRVRSDVWGANYRCRRAEKQEFGKANWDDQIAMYTICAIAPVFLVQALYDPRSRVSLIRLGKKLMDTVPCPPP
jgi:hypothetical protein